MSRLCVAAGDSLSPCGLMWIVGSSDKKSRSSCRRGALSLATLNVPNRTLFIRDNLDVLRGINSESIDLIATDPPFNKGVKDFEGITRAGENVSYKDVWSWSDVQTEWTNAIQSEHPALHSVIQAATASAGDDMGAFLCWLAVRVLECHRILKPTGSMYLHIDHTAHAYVKAMMDAIFGRSNFRNEIVWAYTGPGNTTRWFPRKHDTILFYVREDSAKFNRDAVRVPYTRITGTGHNSLSRGSRSDEEVQAAERKYAERGKVPEDWWTDIAGGGHISRTERTGYPTQKPLALYERIVKASSNPGDVVLDPFAGCATTCVAAERLGRQWIGIDINERARGVIRDRLQSEVIGSMAWDTIVQTPTDLPARTDGGTGVTPELVLISPRPKGPRISVRELRERLAREDGAKCQGCGWTPPNGLIEYLEVDHKQPKSLGGKDDIRNRVLLCAPCNGVKGNKLTLAELRHRRIDEGRVLDPSWTAHWFQREGRFG